MLLKHDKQHLHHFPICHHTSTEKREATSKRNNTPKTDVSPWFGMDWGEVWELIRRHCKVFIGDWRQALGLGRGGGGFCEFWFLDNFFYTFSNWMEVWPDSHELHLFPIRVQKMWKIALKVFLFVWVCEMFYEIFFRSHSWLENFHPKCILSNYQISQCF